jgi:cell filamentation protein
VSDDPYLYPGTSVLRNRLGTSDPDYLDKQERALVALRMRRNVPRGAFDLKHLRAIHRHLFQDVYDWAGELRTVEISKGSNSSSAGSSRPAWRTFTPASSAPAS